MEVHRKSTKNIRVILEIRKQTLILQSQNSILVTVRTKDKYNEAEKLLCESLSEIEKSLIDSSSIDLIWIEVLGDPFLRRFLLRAALGLFKAMSENDEFAPTCYPLLPESFKAESVICSDAIKRLTSFLDVIDQFNV